MSSDGTDVHVGGQTSVTDVFSETSADGSVATTLRNVSVTPSMASVRMAPVTRGRKPEETVTHEEHDSVVHMGYGSDVRPVSVLSEDSSSTRDSGDVLSVDDTSTVQSSTARGSPPPLWLCSLCSDDHAS